MHNKSEICPKSMSKPNLWQQANSQMLKKQKEKKEKKTAALRAKRKAEARARARRSSSQKLFTVETRPVSFIWSRITASLRAVWPVKGRECLPLPTGNGKIERPCKLLDELTYPAVPGERSPSLKTATNFINLFRFFFFCLDLFKPHNCCNDYLFTHTHTETIS